tara:strand:+ start:61 stop:1065 length:1005 start_codon:yes stop_codon:yes gene_type:complete
MNDTVETPATEVAAEIPQETPAHEAAEQQVDQVDVQQEAASEQIEPEQPTTEEVQKVSPERLESLLDALGEIPETPSEALLETLDAKSVENLPDSMKGLFKHMVAAERQRVKQMQEKLSSRNEELEKKFEELKEQNRVVIRNRAQLNEVLMDPKFQEYLKHADVPEEELKDPFSQEGIEQRIKKGVAEAMREFQRPIHESATRAQQMARYQDFVAAHPKMTDKAFKTDVRDLMQERKNSGSALALEDAYALVERNRLVAAQEKQTTRDRLKRSESARNVSRSTVSSSNDGGDPVPKWVTEKGYKGSRGNTARIHYLRDNPAALQKLRAQQKSRR